MGVVQYLHFMARAARGGQWRRQPIFPKGLGGFRGEGRCYQKKFSRGASIITTRVSQGGGLSGQVNQFPHLHIYIHI